MFERPARMVTWVFLLVLGGCLVELARRTDASGLRTLWQFCAVVMFGSAIVAGVDWVIWRGVVRYRQYREALAITDRVSLIHAVSKLDENHVRLLESGTPVVEVLAGDPQPLFHLKVGSNLVPFDFIALFLSLGDGEFLAPVGSWAEGSKRREWAQYLTNFFILTGYAETSKGNRPARWRDQNAALAWIGWKQIHGMYGQPVKDGR